MNRRSFLSEIIKGTAAAMAAPQVVMHGLHLRRRLVEPVEAIINPEWASAPFEKFLFDPNRIVVGWSSETIAPPEGCLFDPTSSEELVFISDPFPKRFLDPEGRFEISPFVLKPKS